MKRKPLAAGQVWVTRQKATRTPSRRIIDVLNGYVCYSTGSDTSRWCHRSQFRLWIRTYKAKATRTAQARTLTLRAFKPEPVKRSARREASHAHL